MKPATRVMPSKAPVCARVYMRVGACVRPVCVRVKEDKWLCSHSNQCRQGGKAARRQGSTSPGLAARRAGGVCKRRKEAGEKGVGGRTDAKLQPERRQPDRVMRCLLLQRVWGLVQRQTRGACVLAAPEAPLLRPPRGGAAWEQAGKARPHAAGGGP